MQWLSIYINLWYFLCIWTRRCFFHKNSAWARKETANTHVFTHQHFLSILLFLVLYTLAIFSILFKNVLVFCRPESLNLSSSFLLKVKLVLQTRHKMIHRKHFFARKLTRCRAIDFILSFNFTFSNLLFWICSSRGFFQRAVD